MFARWCSDSKDSCRILQEAMHLSTMPLVISSWSNAHRRFRPLVLLVSGGHTMTLAFSIAAGASLARHLTSQLDNCSTNLVGALALPPLVATGSNN